MADDGDDYERRYMQGDGDVIHRAKMRAPWWYFLIFAFPIAIEIVAFAIVATTVKNFSPALLVVPALLVPFMAVLALLFSVLRVTVSRKTLHVQYGLFGPKIAIDAIQSADVVAYDWKKYGGWGIRRGRDGSWAYNMVGDSGRAVKVIWTSPEGKINTHLLVASDPDALAGAIARARIGNAHLKSAGARLRVQAENAKSADQLLADAEREAIDIERSADLTEGRAEKEKTTTE